MKFNSPLPILAEEMLNRGNTRHQNRLCFLCYFLCTSKESNEKDDECLYFQFFPKESIRETQAIEDSKFFGAPPPCNLNSEHPTTA
jgi:hypothetical protein